MLYEVLTGTLPIAGSRSVVLASKHRRVAEPRTLRREIPRDLNDLCVKLLEPAPEHRLSLDGARDLLLGRRALRPARGLEPVRKPPFVGRGAELSQLLEAFERGAQGTPFVVIRGESGIGKTTLLRHFVSEVARRDPALLVFEGRCHERELIPYNALDGIMDGVARHLERLPAAEVAEVLPPDAALLALLFPVLLRIPALARMPRASADRAAPEDERERAFSCLRALFTRLAARAPSLLVVDDLHWADDDALRALSRICQAPSPPGLALVFTRREPLAGGAASAPLERTLHITPRNVEIAGLALDDAAALAAALHDGPCSGELSRQLAAEAAGHPLFLEELVRHAQQRRETREDDAAGSRTLTLDDVIGDRLDALDADVRHLANVIAIAHRPLPRRIAMSAARLEPGQFKLCLSRLATRSLIRPKTAREEGRIEMYHARVRDALVTRLEFGQRRALHAALARAHAAEPSTDDEALAIHYREAGDATRAYEHALRAGEAALRSLAFEGAATWFQAALELLESGDERRQALHVRVASSWQWAGRSALAVPHLEAAARGSTGLDAAYFRCQTAQQLWRSGQLELGRELSRQVLRELGLRVPRTPIGSILAIVRDELALRVRGVVVQPPSGSRSLPALRSDACWSFGGAFAESASGSDALTSVLFHQRALRYALKSGDTSRSIGTLSTYIMLASVPGGRAAPRTARLLDQLEQLACRDGGGRSKMLYETAAAVRSYFNGQLAQAANGLIQVIDSPADASADFAQERDGFLLRLLLRALWMLGSLRRMSDWYERGSRRAVARADSGSAWAIEIGAGSCLHLARDQPEEAERRLDAALGEGGFQADHLMYLNGLLTRVTIKLYTSDVEQAHALALELFARARRLRFWRVQPTRLLVLYALGCTALAQLEHGIGDRARRLADAARAAWAIEREGMGWMSPYARVLRAGVALHRGGAALAALELGHAEAEFAAREMRLMALAAQAWRRRLSADASGDVRAVHQHFEREGIVAPARWMQTLVPGWTGTLEGTQRPADAQRTRWPVAI